MNARELVNYFKIEYDLHCKVPYFPVWSRDTKLMQQILDTVKDVESVGEKELQEAITKYFELDNETYSILFFRCKLNELLFQKKKSKKTVRKMANPEAWRFNSTKKSH